MHLGPPKVPSQRLKWLKMTIIEKHRKKEICFLGMIVIDPYGTLGPVWGTVGGPKLGPNKLTI